jgi:hypothetical protein
MGPRTGLDDMENIMTLPGLELRHLIRPARRQFLYRLSNPRSVYTGANINAGSRRAIKYGFSFVPLL